MNVSRHKSSSNPFDFQIHSTKKLLNRAIVFISSNNSSKSLKSISDVVFENWEGPDLEQHLIGIILILIDEGYVKETISGDGFSSIKSYSITGKGKNLCYKTRFIYKNSPYSYHIFIGRLENVFTKYLPIFLSAISLIVAILAYKHSVNIKN